MAPTTVHDVPDHLLRRVLGLLDSHDAVVRAAAVCTRWRRLSSTCGFMMRWYDRDKFSTCLGHYHAVVDPSSFSSSGTTTTSQRRPRVVFVPASPPSIEPRHFSLDFLPAAPAAAPELVDGYGSLLLLASQRRDFFPDLVVCDPLTRSFVKIQPIKGMKYSRCLGAFLGYMCNYNVISISSFRVTCVLYDRADGMAGGVSAVTARAYNHRSPPVPVYTRFRNGWEKSLNHRSLHLRGAESARYAGRDCERGSVFWSVEDDGTVFSCKLISGEFEQFRVPEHRHGSTFRFVASSRGVRVRLVSVAGDELRVFANREYYHEENPNGWVQEASLRLPEATRGLPGHKECYFRRGGRIVTSGEDYAWF